MINKSKIYLFLNSIIDRGRSCKILLYHRVANITDDPYLLSVSVSNFKNQIKWLKNNYKIIPLIQMVDQIKHQSLSLGSLCITFDDGYADNYYNALPILKQFNVPATIFVTSGMIGKKNPFYWDRNTSKIDQGRSINKKELIKLIKEPLIEIGSHTVNHPRLTTQSLRGQEFEIKSSKFRLENMVNRKLNGFSYPFGTKQDYNIDSINIVKKTGYTYATANYPNHITNNTNLFALPRFIIRNWSIEMFKLKMRGII